MHRPRTLRSGGTIGLGVVLLAACGEPRAAKTPDGANDSSETTGSADRPNTGGASPRASAHSASNSGGAFAPPACAESPETAATAPQLSTGTWTNISPPNVPFDSKATAITQGMTIDP